MVVSSIQSHYKNWFPFSVMEWPIPSSVNAAFGSIPSQAIIQHVMSAVNMQLPAALSPTWAKFCLWSHLNYFCSLSLLPFTSAQTIRASLVKTMVNARSRVSSLAAGLCFVLLLFFIRFLSSISFVVSIPSCLRIMSDLCMRFQHKNGWIPNGKSAARFRMALLCRSPFVLIPNFRCRYTDTF